MWIVTYFIIRTVFYPCPAPAPKIDEFGRESRVFEQISVLCGKTDSVYVTKNFNNKDSALAFMKRGQADSTAYAAYVDNLYLNDDYGRLCCFKLDTAHLNPPGFRNSQIKRK